MSHVTDHLLFIILKNFLNQWEKQICSNEPIRALANMQMEQTFNPSYDEETKKAVKIWQLTVADVRILSCRLKREEVEDFTSDKW